MEISYRINYENGNDAVITGMSRNAIERIANTTGLRYEIEEIKTPEKTEEGDIAFALINKRYSSDYINKEYTQEDIMMIATAAINDILDEFDPSIKGIFDDDIKSLRTLLDYTKKIYNRAGECIKMIKDAIDVE